LNGKHSFSNMLYYNKYIVLYIDFDGSFALLHFYFIVFVLYITMCAKEKIDLNRFKKLINLA